MKDLAEAEAALSRANLTAAQMKWNAEMSRLVLDLTREVAAVTALTIALAEKVLEREPE